MEEWMQAVLACQTEEDADRAFNEILERYFLYEHNPTRWSPQAAERVLRERIGYISGYHDRETQLRLLRLFKTEHPIFGTEECTWEQAFWSGIRLGQECGGNLELSREEYERMMHLTKDVKKWRSK